jgi:adenine-specific DNA-methyltransferase
MGQVMTPAPVARFMASLFDNSNRDDIRLLDAGAGVGSLSAAFVEEFYTRRRKPGLISITAYELESRLLEYISTTFNECRDECNAAGVSFLGDIRKQDFIEEGVGMLSERLFSKKGEEELFTHAILNPPYKKIRSDSKYRLILRKNID